MKEDIQFLKELQQELITQEIDGQAAPRFWSIMDYRVVPGNEEYDNGYHTHFYNDGDHTEFKNYKDLKEFLEDYFEEEVESDTELQELLNDENESFYDLWDYVDDNLNDNGHFSKVFVKKEEYLIPNTMFLTKAEAKRHLELNHYHYTGEAHTYAMTSWRAPKVERLLNILETFNWGKIEELAEEKSFFLNAYVEKVMSE